jgi:hypothetical protein
MKYYLNSTTENVDTVDYILNSMNNAGLLTATNYPEAHDSIKQLVTLWELRLLHDDIDMDLLGISLS